ncbi:copper-containing nitrite reductase [Cocleimonas flava]|uniref:Copper-containing nitrite reductase n=1 Tax=Cocleimonas flava TaxID=634765 RepID=A0A4R1F2G0_9GAMM|nr:copper-containing nitrite reductase [Cocleimonas flava]TCJ88337.1 dissimilatory nitrite reductase (NO-forming) copper type apoprotein [Cocleimonas flava]
MMQMKRRDFLLSAIAATSAALVTSSSAVAEAPTKIGEIGVEANVKDLERVSQKLVNPPFLPEHDQVAKGGPKVVQVVMDIEEKEIEIKPGVFVQAMTFNGTNPGPMMVVHEGDYLELTLRNPLTNTMTHNIDFHASTGALGGGGLTHVAPGQQTILRIKCDRPGVFVYHCAPGGIMIPYHVVTGMYGALLVLPRDGLKDNNGKSVTYDKVYYIGEQGWYVPFDDKTGKYKRYSSPIAAMGDTLKIMEGLNPTHITFNGKVGALTGDNAMTAKVGETVLFLHSQANEDTRIHLIGGHGDLVWPGGSFNNTPTVDRETWSILGGEAGAAMYTFKQPGVYAYVNHNLIEAVMLGALGHVSVEGEWNNDLMEQVQKAGPIV